jgi:hypothetical protein
MLNFHDLGLSGSQVGKVGLGGGDYLRAEKFGWW